MNEVRVLGLQPGPPRKLEQGDWEEGKAALVAGVQEAVVTGL
jgi:hypothetical protein